VLLAFNTADALTVAQLAALVGISRPVLVEQLLALTSTLHPILRSSRPVYPPPRPSDLSRCIARRVPSRADALRGACAGASAECSASRRVPTSRTTT
jgi:hypothetical protein